MDFNIETGKELPEGYNFVLYRGPLKIDKIENKFVKSTFVLDPDDPEDDCISAFCLEAYKKDSIYENLQEFANAKYLIYNKNGKFIVLNVGEIKNNIDISITVNLHLNRKNHLDLCRNNCDVDSMDELAFHLVNYVNANPKVIYDVKQFL